MDQFILSIDQGTTSCRAIVFDLDGKLIGAHQKEFSQHFPKPGWVEHDAEEILDVQVECIKQAVKSSQVKAEQIAAVGLTNQRETTVIWDKKTTKPIANAIVWQCRRTQELAEKLKAHIDKFRRKTGLLPDAYFSGPKIKWLLDNVEGAANRAKKDELAFGTIDSWLIKKLTVEANHFTDSSNASRTMLFDINTLKWDDELLELVGVPRSMMPRVVASNAFFGNTNKDLLGFSAPILGVLGDQQAALFGQACFEPGMFKCTYGTGSFILGNIGEHVQQVNGLLTTVAWLLEGQKPIYALEGANFVSGAAVQWLRDALAIIPSSNAAEEMATSIPNNEGVYMVPAFVGLGSPWWNSDVRGAIFGITRGTGKAHFVRAALESMAYQIKDVQEAITRAEVSMTELRVDGGATTNNFLMQFQASLLGIPVKRAEQVESTAWGVAALAAMSARLRTSDQLAQGWRAGRDFVPKENLNREYAGWKSALAGAVVVSIGKDS